MNSRSKLVCNWSRGVVLAFALGITGALQADEALFSLHIKGQNAGSALLELGERAGVQVMVPPNIGKSVQVAAINGEYTLSAALDKMLAGTGLAYEITADNVVLVKVAEAGVDTGQSGIEKSRSRVIEEVVVTATKRETSIQDTSMSITAIGNEEIGRRGLVGMGDYLNSVPGVSVLDQNAGNTTIVMRGLAASAQTDGNTSGPTVGIYFGETPIAGLAAVINSADIKLVDIERVEVLRGPQGTLYGSSNLGGTVRNVPVAPDLYEVGGHVEAGYSNTSQFGGDNTEFQGAVNIPLIKDKLAVRVVGYRFNNSGFYKNIGPNNAEIAMGVQDYGAMALEKGDIGSDEVSGGRISALWKPMDKLSFNLMYLHQEIDQDGWPSSDLVLGKGDYKQRRYQIRDVANVDLTNIGEINQNERFEDEVDIFNGTIEYDFGWMRLLSSTSFVEEDSSIRVDYGPLFFGFVPVSHAGISNSEAFFQEIRVTTEFEGPLQIAAGLYYEDIKLEGPFWNLFGGDPAVNPYGRMDFIVGTINRDIKQKAVFGEASYQLSDVWKLTVGARAFSYSNDRFERYDPSAFFPSESIAVTESDDTDVNYKAGLDYTPNDDVLLYASWSQGFRLGRPVAATTSLSCDTDGDGFFDGSDRISTGPRQLESDFVDNYELGGKFTFLDSRLRINADIYQLDWDGIPVIVLFETGCGAFLNAGKAISRGVEFEGSYALHDSLLLNLGASYIDAELAEDAPGVGSDGDRLPGSPRYNFNAGLQYEFLLANYNAFIRGDYYYVGGFYNNLKETGQEAGDYGQLSMRLGVDINNLNLEVFAKNITNENAYTWINELGGNQIGFQLRPRTIGISVGYSF